MTSPLTFFTAKLNYQVIEADTVADPDYDPQVQGVNAGVTITPFIVQPPPTTDDVQVDEIPASSLSPAAATVVLAPVRARLDNGELCLRADPDTVTHSYPSMSDFPATGVVAQLYFAADTGLTYRWFGSQYVAVDAFAPVRLAAMTPVLELPAQAYLAYAVAFDHVTFNGADQTLPGFAFKAPTADIVLDLTSAERVP